MHVRVRTIFASCFICWSNNLIRAYYSGIVLVCGNTVSTVLILIHEISTSPDGKFLVFLSARSSVDSGAHSATNSLHRIDWPKEVKFDQSAKVHDVVIFFLQPLQF
jgi:hypothetical protein